MWRWASWAILVSLCSGFCLLAAGSRAQIYEWTDDHGRVRLTDDLSQVPPGQRSEAEREVNGSGSKHGWNHVPLYPQGTRATASPTSLAPRVCLPRSTVSCGSRIHLGPVGSGSSSRLARIIHEHQGRAVATRCPDASCAAFLAFVSPT